MFSAAPLLVLGVLQNPTICFFKQAAFAFLEASLVIVGIAEADIANAPVPSLDLRGRPFGSDAQIPPMDIDPPVVNIVDGKPQLRSESQNSRGRVGEWLTRMVGQNRGGSSSPAAGARYAPLDQRDD